MALAMTLNFLGPLHGHIALAATDAPPIRYSDTTAAPKAQVWHLPNGDVELYPTISNFNSFSLKNPILLGSGGGGAVFSTDVQGGANGGEKIAVKISWARSADSVRRECQILQRLEKTNTRNVERCLDLVDYPQDTSRVMIALEPVVENAVQSISQGQTPPNAEEKAVRDLIRTMVDMLAANIVTADVQILVDPKIGSILLIDMTEANIMSTPPSFLDLALASSFMNEIVSWIPENTRNIASTTLLEELMQADKKGMHFSQEIFDLMLAQDTLMRPEIVKYLEHKKQ